MNPLSLLILTFICRRSLSLTSVLYPPRPRRCCCPLVYVCVCLSSDATIIPVEPLAFSPFPRYLSSFPARPTPSYLRHPSISSSLQFAPPPKYFIPPPPPTPSLYISLLYVYIYLYIYLLSLTLSILSLSLSLCIYLFLLIILVTRPLNHFLTIYY